MPTGRQVVVSTIFSTDQNPLFPINRQGNHNMQKFV